jgi:two-component system KDP operon response regulator KdpE
MTTAPTILIIDDEEQMRRLLKITFEAQHYRVHEASNGKEGIIQAAMVRPELIVLDMGLGDMEGFDVLNTIRGWSRVPVIILSVQGSEQEKVRMLDAGADDYVTKPFSAAELIARVRVALRRGAQPEDGETALIQRGAVTIDLANRMVTRNGEAIKLTATEFALLRMLATHAGRVLTHSQILREVWGASYSDATHYVHVQVAALRRKLEEHPNTPRLILTESGVGYRFAAS